MTRVYITLTRLHPTVATGRLPTVSPPLTTTCPQRPPLSPLTDPHFFIQTPQEADVPSQGLQLAFQLHLAEENLIHILGEGDRNHVSLLPPCGPTLAGSGVRFTNCPTSTRNHLQTPASSFSSPTLCFCLTLTCTAFRMPSLINPNQFYFF